MSSKAKRPTIAERLIRFKDIAMLNRAWNQKYAELVERVKKLEEREASS